ncbi:hypothetical protein CYMTET_14828 [Cymbomonas tetramitiformis]|uniref:Kringle domain-containing protein n=1 Tax=Cymbomonas tetramitiformis TaxID=36881 RepID=A0AAE0L9I7_9CHLO|nr:hypothetical protein CYMTET_14828 [Cymbomonas tetramitiformis]
MLYLTQPCFRGVKLYECVEAIHLPAGAEQIGETVVVQDPQPTDVGYEDLFEGYYFPSAIFRATFRLLDNFATFQVLQFAAIDEDGSTNSESNVLTIEYTKGLHVPLGLRIWGHYLNWGEHLCVEPEDMESRALPISDCYRELCFGGKCSITNCTIYEVTVEYNEENDSVFPFEAVYSNAILLDGDALTPLEMTQTIAPGERRHVTQQFRYGDVSIYGVEEGSLENLVGSYGDASDIPYWGKAECEGHNLTIELDYGRNARFQGWVTLGYCQFGCSLPSPPPRPPPAPGPPPAAPSPPLNCYWDGDFGVSYRGNTAVTREGYDCLRWNRAPLSGPDPEYYLKFDWLTTPDNVYYCRNPENDPGGPWCFTQSEEKRWDYCEIDICTSPRHHPLPPPPPPPPPRHRPRHHPATIATTTAASTTPPLPPPPSPPCPPPESPAKPPLVPPLPPPPQEPPLAPSGATVVDIALKWDDREAVKEFPDFEQYFKEVIADIANDQAVTTENVVIYDILSYDSAVVKSVVYFPGLESATSFIEVMRCCADTIFGKHHELGVLGEPRVLQVGYFKGAVPSPPPPSSPADEAFTETPTFLAIVYISTFLVLIAILYYTKDACCAPISVHINAASLSIWQRVVKGHSGTAFVGGRVVPIEGATLIHENFVIDETSDMGSMAEKKYLTSIGMAPVWSRNGPWQCSAPDGKSLRQVPVLPDYPVDAATGRRFLCPKYEEAEQRPHEQMQDQLALEAPATGEQLMLEAPPKEDLQEAPPEQLMLESANPSGSNSADDNGDDAGDDPQSPVDESQVEADFEFNAPRIQIFRGSSFSSNKS